jgi:hypothetical protein
LPRNSIGREVPKTDVPAFWDRVMSTIHKPMRDSAYLAFLRTEGYCIVCSRMPAEPCHGPVNGMSSKGPDNGCVPMCRRCHEEQHSIGWPAFEVRRMVSRERSAKVWRTVYLSWKANGKKWTI